MNEYGLPYSMPRTLLTIAGLDTPMPRVMRPPVASATVFAPWSITPGARL